MGNDFLVTNVAGGKLNKVKEIDLVKKITYPEPLMPEGVNDIKRKGFKLMVPASIDPQSFTYTMNPLEADRCYLNEISVTPSLISEDDYWELEIGEDKPLETMYTEEVSDSGILMASNEIFRKVPLNSEIVFTFYNNSGTEKKVFVTIGWIFRNVNLE